MDGKETPGGRVASGERDARWPCPPEVSAMPLDHVNGVELYWEQRGGGFSGRDPQCCVPALEGATVIVICMPTGNAASERLLPHPPWINWAGLG